MTESEARNRLLDLLEELGAIQSVRGALLADSHGAFANGERSGLDPAIANDVAKTVRRMVVATSTVGAPLDELVINFGPSRMLVAPVHEDATLIVLLERNTAVAAVRSLIQVQIGDVVELLRFLDVDTPEVVLPLSEAEDEVERLLTSDLGPVLSVIESCFTDYFTRTGRSPEEAAASMREQIKEWLLCCNPSPYTFPLLLDGLAQVLESPEIRTDFISEVQDTVRKSRVWSAAKAAGS